MLPSWSGRAQERLRSQLVLLAGGGVAADGIALALAGAGVGGLLLCDASPWAAVRVRDLDARCRLSEVRGSIDDGAGGGVTGLEASPLTAGVALVIDAGAGASRRAELARLAEARRVPWLLAGGEGWDARALIVDPEAADAPCVRCLVGGPVDMTVPVAAAAAWAGQTVAAAALRFLAGLGIGSGRLQVYSALAGDVRSLRLRRDPACPHRGSA